MKLKEVPKLKIDESDLAKLGECKASIIAVNYVSIYYKHATYLLHRFLTKAKVGQSVDHINHDPRDNRRVNLRLTTHKGNHANRKESNSKLLFSIKTGLWGFRYAKFRSQKVYFSRQEALEARNVYLNEVKLDEDNKAYSL